jgi:hypothetical protein
MDAVPERIPKPLRHIAYPKSRGSRRLIGIATSISPTADAWLIPAAVASLTWAAGVSLNLNRGESIREPWDQVRKGGFLWVLSADQV